jgi:hypothetical protein
MRRAVPVSLVFVACLGGSASAQSTAPSPPSPASSASSIPIDDRQGEPSRPSEPAGAQPGADAAAGASGSEALPRRAGFVIGLATGIALGSAHGYPNDFNKIDNPAYRAYATGPGRASTIWLGGALAEWFTFGLGLSADNWAASKLKTSATAFVFHLEGYPLMSMGGVYRDVGFSADFGTGGSTIATKDGVSRASSGAFSMVGGGFFWETWRFASDHIALGPALLGQYEVSDSMTRYMGLFAIRGSYYGGS